MLENHAQDSQIGGLRVQISAVTCLLLKLPIIGHFGMNRLCILKMGHSQPLFLYFHLFNTQLTLNKCSINFWRRLDSNRGPLVLEATTLPTEPQPLPTADALWSKCITWMIFNHQFEVPLLRVHEHKLIIGVSYLSEWFELVDVPMTWNISM